jgi:hypothetical protein
MFDRGRLAPFWGSVPFRPLLRKLRTKSSWSGKSGVELMVPDGIIAHLTRQCGGNVHDCGVVKVTGSESLIAGRLAPKNVADLEDDSEFVSRCSKNLVESHWIAYDFGSFRVTPTHYAIRSYAKEVGGGHLRSWVIEGSNDGKTWEPMDRREDNTDLCGQCKAATFEVAQRQMVAHLRISTVGMNHAGNDGLMLSAWEIFGSLVGPTEAPQ